MMEQGSEDKSCFLCLILEINSCYFWGENQENLPHKKRTTKFAFYFKDEIKFCKISCYDNIEFII